MAKALSRKVTIYINGKEVEGTINSITARIKQLENEQKKLPLGTQEYIDKSMELKKLRAILHEQKVAVNDLGREWKDTTQKIAEASNVIMGLQSVFQMGDVAIGKLKDLAKDAAALDDVYADVMKTTGLTHEQVEKLNEAFKNMNTRTSREQLNQLAYEAGKLGINSTEAVAGFVSAADKINIALGDVLGEGAMVAIGKLADVYSKSTQQLADASGDIEKQMLSIGSAINMLGQSSTANEHYLVDFMGRLGGIATQAGLSADQILGFASALDQDMQKVEMSATAFQKLIQQMIKKPGEFVAAAKMPLAEFQKLMEVDMNEAIKRVLKGFNEMGGLNQLIPIFKDMGLDGARAASVVSAMASSLDKINEAQAIANRELTTGNSVLNEFNTKNNNAQANLEKAKKKFEEMRLKLGNDLYPVLVHLQKTGTVLLKGVAGFVEILKSNKAILPGLIALLANWLRVKTLSYIANNNLGKSIKSLIGIEKLQGHQTDLQRAKELKRIAVQEQERLKTMQNTLAIEKENLARQQGSRITEVQKLATITKNRVYGMEVAVTEQATRAEAAHAAAINASKKAFSSTPWGLIIAALTSIAALTVKIVKNSTAWKVSDALKAAGRAAGEAEGNIRVLTERLRGAKEGSEEYVEALEELRREYPDIIALHVDEKGAIRDIEAAYKDLSAAAKQSAYDRVYAEKTAEAYGGLGEEVQEQLQYAMRGGFQAAPGYRQETYTEAVKAEVQAIVGRYMREISEGKKTAREAYRALNEELKRLGVATTDDNSALAHENMNASSKVIDALTAVENKYKEVEKTVKSYKDALKPEDADPFGVQKMSLKELEDELERYLDMMEHGFSEGAERDAARLKAYRDQIAKLKKKQPTSGTAGGGGGYTPEESEKDKKKREREEAAWSRFEQNYNQMIDRMNAKTLTGAAKVLADVDNSIEKMEDDLQAVISKHPEAQKMLDDLRSRAEEWKQAELQKYIAKMGDEIDKLKKQLKGESENEYINKVEQAAEKLRQQIADIDAAILQAQNDASLATGEERQQLMMLTEEYRQLKKVMLTTAFSNIDTSSENNKKPLHRDQIGERASSKMSEKQSSGLSFIFDSSTFEAYGRAIDEINKKYKKQKEKIEKKAAAEEEMATEYIRLSSQASLQGNQEEAERLLKEADAHTAKRDALEAEAEAMDGLREEAEMAAEEDAFGKAIDRWIAGIEKFGQQAMQIWGSINTILNNNTQQQINNAKKEHEAKTKELDKQLDEGIISQEEYNERKEKIQTEYDEKEKALQLEIWKRQKALNIGQAVMEGALAVLKALSSAPPPYNAVLAGISGALAAVQIAAIASEPEPYAKGGYVERRTVYQAGEAGPEWVASNRLLSDPATAPVIDALESYQRGNRRALSDIPMAQLNMPVASRAAAELGRRRSISEGGMAAAFQNTPQNITVAMPEREEELDILRELAKYLKDPKNRQAYISRRTMEDFDKQEDFLRNRARI